MKFYHLDFNELKMKLATDFEHGLTSGQAKERLAKDGQNFRAHYGALRSRLRMMRMHCLFLVAALVYVAAALFQRDIRPVWNALIVFLIPALSSVLCHIILGLVGKRNRKDSPLAYGKLTVLRDGKETAQSFRDITYGDVVLLKRGDYVPFDARVLDTDNFVVDESRATGCTAAVKTATIVSHENAAPADQVNTVFSSSYVIKGTARVVVTDISNRVYVKRSLKSKNSGKKPAVRVTDFAKLLTLILLILLILFGLICGIISGGYLSFAASCVLLIAAFSADFHSIVAAAGFYDCSHRLAQNSIFLKSLSAIDRINETDTLLIKMHDVFDTGAEITGFSAEGEYHSLSDVSKSNFSVFLYACFCYENAKAGSYGACLRERMRKILLGIGVDYQDIKSMCPVLTNYENVSAGYDLSGIVYDGSNVLIAAGDYNSVLKLCSQNEQTYAATISRLREQSTEIIAVAVKQVDAFDENYTDLRDGFRLVGLIGLKRTLAPEKLRMVKDLEEIGIHTVSLFSGGENAAKSVQYCDASGLAPYSDASPVRNAQVLYGYHGSVEQAAQLCAAQGHPCLYLGRSDGEEGKNVPVGTLQNNMYDSRENLVVTDGSLSSLTRLLTYVKSAYANLNDALVNTVAFSMFFVVCGTLFTVLYHQPLFSAGALGLLLFCALPVASFCSLSLLRRKGARNMRAFAAEPLQKRGLLFSFLSVIMFLALTALLKLTVDYAVASGFLCVAFVAFLPVPLTDIRCASPLDYLTALLGYLPAVVCVILFCSPLATLLSVTGMSVWLAIPALLTGAAVKYCSSFFSGSVKI